MVRPLYPELREGPLVRRVRRVPAGALGRRAPGRDRRRSDDPTEGPPPGHCRKAGRNTGRDCLPEHPRARLAHRGSQDCLADRGGRRPAVPGGSAGAGGRTGSALTGAPRNLPGSVLHLASPGRHHRVK